MWFCHGTLICQEWEFYFYEDHRKTSHIQEWKLRTIKLICALQVVSYEATICWSIKWTSLTHISVKNIRILCIRKEGAFGFFIIIILFWALFFFHTQLEGGLILNVLPFQYQRSDAVLISFNKNANAKSNYICLSSFDHECVTSPKWCKLCCFHCCALYAMLHSLLLCHKWFLWHGIYLPDIKILASTACEF